MNTLDVLYKNRGFKAPNFDGKMERNEDFVMQNLHTDKRLERLLRQANINYREKLKKIPSAKIVKIFHKHPRNFYESDLFGDPCCNVESDFDENDIIDAENKFKKSKYVAERYLQNLKFLKVTEDVKTVTTRIPSDLDLVPKQEKVTKKKSKTKNNKATKEPVIIEQEKMNTKSKNVDIVEENVLGVVLEQTMFKIAGWIQEINSLMHGDIKLPEDNEDYLRREKCTIEFSSRFSRQYLYQFDRQLESLKRLTYRPNAIVNNANKNLINNLNRCLTNLCTITLQSVQAYCHHVPMTMITENTMKNNSVHIKFIKMLTDISEFCGIIKTLSDIFVDVKDILSASEEVKRNSQMLATLLRDRISNRLENQTSTTLRTAKKSTKVTRKYFNENDLPYHKKFPLESRLSMYCVNLKQKLAAAGKCNRMAAVKPKVIIPRNKLVAKPCIKSKPLPIIVHNKSLRSLPLKPGKAVPISDVGSSINQAKINEDEIETMVQMKERNKQKQEFNFQEDLMERVKPLVNNLLAQVASDNKNHMSPAFTEELINSLQGLFLHMAGGGFEKQVPNTPQTALSVNNSRINVSGVDNAKLIVIKDKSMFGPDRAPGRQKNVLVKPKRIISELPTKEKIVAEPVLLPACRRTSNNQLVIATNSMNAETIQIKRRKRNNKHNEITIANVSFDKKFLTNVLTYRCEFLKFAQNHPLYQRGNCITPWELGTWISEKMLNYSIEAVLMEINKLDLPQTVYLSEFK